MSICGVARDVSNGGVTGGLLVLLVSKHMKTNAMKVPMFQLSFPLKNSFKTSSVYYMHPDTFSNCFVMSSF